jgi:hypothetical protein
MKRNIVPRRSPPNTSVSRSPTATPFARFPREKAVVPAAALLALVASAVVMQRNVTKMDAGLPPR